MPKFQAKLSSVSKLTPNTFWVRLDFNTDINYQPGQYVVCRFPKDSGGFENRTYSVAKTEFSEQQKCLYLLVSGAENGFSYQYFDNQSNLGKEVDVIGPSGKFVLKSETSPKFYILTGTGLAPVLAHLQHLNEIKFSGKIKLLCGFKDPSLAIIPTKIANFGSLEIEIIYCFSDLFSPNKDKINQDFPSLDSHIFQGRVTNYLRNQTDLSKLDSATEFYICGHPQMVIDANLILAASGINPQQIVDERFL